MKAAARRLTSTSRRSALRITRATQPFVARGETAECVAERSSKLRPQGESFVRKPLVSTLAALVHAARARPGDQFHS
jgi:hypothetical protein